MKLMFYTCLKYTAKNNLMHIFNNFVHETRFPCVEFSTCSIMLVLTKFWILDWSVGTYIL